MLVSLIISTYNRPDALLLVLYSVERQSKFVNEVIIADDGSDKETKNAVLNFKKNSKLNIVYSWQEDKGFRAAESRNKAIANSIGEYLILIDGDMILHHKFIEDHIKNAEKGFFIQGTRSLLTEKTTKNAIRSMKVNFFFLSKGLRNRKNSINSNLLSKIFTKKANYLQGIKTCNMGFFKQDCLDINGFNSDFIGWGREDSEFAVRLINNGISRKNLRFNSIQFHLWHDENTRVSLNKNDLILKSSIENNLIWCKNGIDKYF
jgi:glycosyltransferase involved in cell wall biosynthesis